MNREPVWTGLHPYRFAFGYAVVLLDGHTIKAALHTYTRRGAESKQRRLQRTSERLGQQRGEAGLGPDPFPSWWEVRRVADHPGRRR